MLACPTCGAARAPGAVYCHVCGEPLPAAAGTPATDPEPVGARDHGVAAPDSPDMPGAPDARYAQPMPADAEPVAAPAADGSASAPLGPAAGALAAAPHSTARAVPWGQVALLSFTVCLALSTAVLLFLFAGTAATASPPGGAPLLATPTLGNPFALTPTVLPTVTTFGGTATPTPTHVSGGGGPGPVPTPTPHAVPTATHAPTPVPSPQPTATKPSF